MEALAEIFQVVGTLALVISPLLLTAAAIVVFYRREKRNSGAQRRSYANWHILSLVSFALASGIVAYRCWLVSVCAAPMPTEHYCGLEGALFAAPAASSAAIFCYLFIFILSTRRHG